MSDFIDDETALPVAKVRGDELTNLEFNTLRQALLDTRDAVLALQALAVPAIIIFGATGGSDTLTRFNYPYYSASTASTVETRMRVPYACVVSAMYISSILPSGGGSTIFTVRKNGAATTLTATVAIGVYTGSDLTHSVTFAAGDEISMSMTGQTGMTTGMSGAICSFKVLPV